MTCSPFPCAQRSGTLCLGAHSTGHGQLDSCCFLGASPQTEPGEGSPGRKTTSFTIWKLCLSSVGKEVAMRSEMLSPSTSSFSCAQVLSFAHALFRRVYALDFPVILTLHCTTSEAKTIISRFSLLKVSSRSQCMAKEPMFWKSSLEGSSVSGPRTGFWKHRSKLLPSPS